MNDYLASLWLPGQAAEFRTPAALIARDVCHFCKRPVVQRDGSHCCMEHGDIIPIRSHVQNGRAINHVICASISGEKEQGRTNGWRIALCTNRIFTTPIIAGFISLNRPAFLGMKKIDGLLEKFGMNEELFYKIFPKAKPGTFDALVAVTPQAELVTGTRLRYFIAQCAHESQGFSRLEENMHYFNASRIRTVWPTRFKTEAEANRYTNRPIELANRVYAGRYGNGDEASGDGWRFRGRGWIGLTFVANYARFFKWYAVEQNPNPDFVSTVLGAAYSAAWYWIDHDLNQLCDSGDFDGVTRKINPAMAGRVERRKILEKLEKHWS